MQWLKAVASSWMSVIHRAEQFKRREFQSDADEAQRFFDGPYDFLYQEKYGDGEKAPAYGLDEGRPNPTFKMTFNKVAEMVQLFGPTMYHRNPYRQVNPTKNYKTRMGEVSGDPGMQQMQQHLDQAGAMNEERTRLLASLLGCYINYTPNELDLRLESRRAIDEALIKGMGLLWTTTYRPPGAPITMIGSFMESVDNLIIDPDMTQLDHAKWIARRRILPKWEVERRFGLPKDSLTGNLESIHMQSEAEAASADYNYYRARGDTNDLFTYFEVYSRMGMGHRMKDIHTNKIGVTDRSLDRFGEHIFLAVSDNWEYPLNLTPAQLNQPAMETFMRVQWPTPFWANPAHPWPFTPIIFHERPRKLWPMSHVKPAMGELKFLNWAFSFIADKIKNTSRDFIGIMKSAGEELKTEILSGRDLTLLEVESIHGTSITDVVTFLQHPNFNADVYKVIEVMMSLLERRLGLNELMYGESSRQMRSASEASIKGDQLRIRPDDMAECVETSMTEVARKEAIAARWHLESSDVAPMLGQEQAQLWEQVVQQSDIHQIVYELDYRIEAGSIRKPNRQRDQETANQVLQNWGPIIQQYWQMTGDPGPMNALAKFWAKAHDYEERKLQFNPPPPPQPDPQAEQEAQLEMQAKQQELELKAIEMQAELQQKQQESQLEMALDQSQHEQEMTQDAAEHVQEMEQDRQKHLLDMLQQRQQGQQQLELAKQQAEVQAQAMKQKAAQAPKPNQSGGSK